ncbi:hypothetical protein RvY_07922 [Ramazzottius varieornatus]|uniref:Uncharacterized protein n=1 Tax=Ramazzottius varieornatus TaxID=947166 RepID=A0A1D1V3Z6_RAMVA|nr:hypothetical protein RvY_07922 [Ramazzottius varieornatus]
MHSLAIIIDVPAVFHSMESGEMTKDSFVETSMEITPLATRQSSSAVPSQDREQAAGRSLTHHTFHPEGPKSNACCRAKRKHHTYRRAREFENKNQCQWTRFSNKRNPP